MSDPTSVSPAALRATRPSDGYLPTTPEQPPENPKEAAAQFEKVLVKQFVKVMTKNMFDASLSGEDGPNWMQGQRRRQRDILTDVISQHIVDSDTLGIRDMLLRQWSNREDNASSPSAPAPASSDDELPNLPPFDRA